MTITTEAPIITRYSPLCPDWCTLNDFEHEEATSVITVSGNRRPVVDHCGPEFGPFSIYATEHLLSDQPLDVRVHAEGEFIMTKVDARELATAATEAAEWMEAHQ